MDIKQSLLNHAEAARDAAQQARQDAKNQYTRATEQFEEAMRAVSDREAMATEYERLAATYYGFVDAEFDPDFREVKQPAPQQQYRVYVDGIEVTNWESFTAVGVMAYIMDKGEKLRTPNGDPALHYISGKVKVVKEDQ